MKDKDIRELLFFWYFCNSTLLTTLLFHVYITDKSKLILLTIKQLETGNKAFLFFWTCWIIREIFAKNPPMCCCFRLVDFYSLYVHHGFPLKSHDGLISYRNNNFVECTFRLRTGSDGWWRRKPTSSPHPVALPALVSINLCNHKNFFLLKFFLIKKQISHK